MTTREVRDVVTDAAAAPTVEVGVVGHNATSVVDGAERRAVVFVTTPAQGAALTNRQQRGRFGDAPSRWTRRPWTTVIRRPRSQGCPAVAGLRHTLRT